MKKAGAWIITVLTVCTILILAVPLLVGAGYTYPAADDFIAENGTAYLSGIVGPIRGPIYAAWNYFMNWQGAYTTNLLLFTIMPFSRFGLSGFRIGMVILSFSFLSSLYFMVNAVINYSFGTESPNDRHSCRNKKLFLYAVLLFTALGLPGTWAGKELFYWYTAALGYLIGISGLFVSIGCLLSANYRDKNKGYYSCSMLFGFMASGVSPQVASFVCSWLLIVVLVLILSAQPGKKPIRIWDVCPFLVSFGGAVINVIAPGSLRRSQATMGEVSYGLSDAIKDTVRVLREEFDCIWHDPVFITLVVFLILVCICLDLRVVRRKRPLTGMGALLVAAAVLVSNFLCVFPVVLGYHGSGLSNDRTRYVADLEIRFSLLFAIVYMAQYLLQILSKKEQGKRKNTVCFAGIVCGILISSVSFLLLKDQPKEIFTGYSYVLIKEISSGTVKEVFNLRKEVLETLEAAEDGTDVYVQMPKMPFTQVTYPQGISADAESQTNKDVADLFHLNSVRVEYGSK